MSAVIRFRNRLRAELFGGIITKDSDPAKVGRQWFFVEYIDEEGERMGVWDGPSYEAGSQVLARWAQDGVRTIDRVSGGEA